MNRDSVRARLTEIEERVSQASPGPWEVYDDNEGDWPPRPLWSVANEQYHGPEDDEAPAFQATIHMGYKADADFIAHAREDVPWLLALLREREEENRRLREALESIRDICEYHGEDHHTRAAKAELAHATASAALRGESAAIPLEEENRRLRERVAHYESRLRRLIEELKR